MVSHKQFLLIVLPWIIVICIQIKSAISLSELYDEPYNPWSKKPTTTKVPLTKPTTTEAPELPSEGKDWIRKEVSAVILMTLEFVKDMDMKMRDVRRVEAYYYGLFDFGAGRLFMTIENKFKHMVMLYRNTSQISSIMQPNINLRSQIVGMLQFMLSDYMEMLSLIDLFKERYSYWKTTSRLRQIKDKIEKFLIPRNVYPQNYFERPDEWR